jgi:phosphotransacetylase
LSLLLLLCARGACTPVLRAGMRIVGLARHQDAEQCLPHVAARRRPTADVLRLRRRPAPSAEELADIAIAAAHLSLTGHEPVIAMLSFSTKGSAAHPDVDTVNAATSLVRRRPPGVANRR